MSPRHFSTRPLNKIDPNGKAAFGYEVGFKAEFAGQDNQGKTHCFGFAPSFGIGNFFNEKTGGTSIEVYYSVGGNASNEPGSQQKGEIPGAANASAGISYWVSNANNGKEFEAIPSTTTLTLGPYSASFGINWKTGTWVASAGVPGLGAGYGIGISRYNTHTQTWVVDEYDWTYDSYQENKKEYEQNVKENPKSYCP